MSDLEVEFAERAATLEYDCGLNRADAERQALGEIIERRLAHLPGGILGELVAAVRRRCDPKLQPELDAAGLVGRAPAWGFGRIVADGTCYRPAAEGETGAPAIIVSVTCDGRIEDLAAQNLATGALLTRIDVGTAVGLDEVDLARAAGRPLLVFASLAAWLRAASRGVVILDWRRAGDVLADVPAILTSDRLAPRIAAATRRHWPQPIIAIHRPGVANAA